MKLFELKEILNQHPTAHLQFVLPNREAVPSHAHVTEVARIDKRFIDCGGTLRNEAFCRLQTWFSDDVGHRLTAAKLTKILDKAKSILGSDELDVDVEHQVGFISQFPLQSAEVSPHGIVFHLVERRTACLAEDKCKPAKKPSDFNPLKFDFREQKTNCCGT